MYLWVSARALQLAPMTDWERKDALAGAVARILDAGYMVTPDQAHVISLALGFGSAAQVLQQAKALRSNPWAKSRWLAVLPQKTSR